MSTAFFPSLVAYIKMGLDTVFRAGEENPALSLLTPARNKKGG
jgi:hypothetical protein